MVEMNWRSYLIDIAKQVRIEVLPMLGTEGGREEIGTRGAGGDQTLAVDLVAENLIKRQIEATDIPVVLISEELGVLHLNGARDTTPLRIIVDPIDGSFNAARGIPYACASIALAEGEKYSDITLGVVLNLFTGDLYSAEKGCGSFLNQKPIHVSEFEICEGSIILSASKTDHFYTFPKKYAAIIDPFKKKRCLGSMALNLCLIAQGATEMYLNDRKHVRAVDIAAGYLILAEAGGVMMDQRGTDFTGSLSIRESGTFVATTAKIAPQIRALFKQVNLAP